MAKLTTKVVTGKVRLSFVHLLAPHAINGGDAKYSTMIIIDKADKATLKKIKSAQKVAYDAAKADKLKGLTFEQVKTTLRDGDDPNDNTGDYPELKGHYFMNLSSTTQPQVIDGAKNPVTSEAEVYSGVYARVSLNTYAYNTSGNKGISAGLNNVQVVADGEHLDGRTSADDDFDEWDDDEEDDDDLLG
ncbi:DUF2815 family protein [Schleiferilactobacillus perolens]|uniref:DUF2815 family protein n=1 Tax=Schleiferilactobacillus perolens DSM 12744 TaxID=1423792 RepID=A0A0R1MXY1_9LACO|nr:DUF2815 family protein [Schleiferilactobacillus perolens]KRL13037.1 hypothetical protein FD09_GL002577 [Schleiferilactobacillus perolens DSM 12744]